ncbi:hypothetical protein FKM82_005889 [Ascaphus truei]
MNLSMSPQRASLNVEHLQNIHFTDLVGLPLFLFNPEVYVKPWLLLGRRRAEETACLKKLLMILNVKVCGDILQCITV